jgi:hypothetical protein
MSRFRHAIALSLALALSACAAEDDGELTTTSFEGKDSEAAGPENFDLEDAEARALCVRTPFGPGDVKFDFNPNGSEWRRKPEDSSSWVGAVKAKRNTDGIHRNGWGCSVYKIPDYCSATVKTNGSIDCCCNAALKAADGGCRWTTYSGIGAPRPPGC